MTSDLGTPTYERGRNLAGKAGVEHLYVVASMRQHLLDSRELREHLRFDINLSPIGKLVGDEQFGFPKRPEESRHQEVRRLKFERLRIARIGHVERPPLALHVGGLRTIEDGAHVVPADIYLDFLRRRELCAVAVKLRRLNLKACGKLGGDLRILASGERLLGQATSNLNRANTHSIEVIAQVAVFEESVVLHGSNVAPASADLGPRVTRVFQLE